MKLTNIPLYRIRENRFQTRFDTGDVKSLAENIMIHGLQQPPTVRSLQGGGFEIVFGSRRVEACRHLGWENIPCFIRDLSDEEAAEITISENLQRENLNPIEEAFAFQRLKELGYSDKKIGERVGRSRPYVSNSLGLLRLDPFLQACLITGKLSISHIRLIKALSPEIPQYRVADIAIDWRLSVDELRDVVEKLKNRELLSWNRVVPINRILFSELDLATIDDSMEDEIVIGMSFHLFDGLGRLLEAWRSGEKEVMVCVVCFYEWLAPDPSSVTVVDCECVDLPGNRFNDTLARLVGDRDEMFSRYPIHSIQLEGEYYKLKPEAPSHFA